MLEAKFPFIKENIFLIAQVDEKSGKQFLAMQRVNIDTKEIEIVDRIECIHIATNLNKEFRLFPDDVEEPNLTLDEKFLH